MHTNGILQTREIKSLFCHYHIVCTIFHEEFYIFKCPIKLYYRGAMDRTQTRYTCFTSDTIKIRDSFFRSGDETIMANGDSMNICQYPEAVVQGLIRIFKSMCCYSSNTFSCIIKSCLIFHTLMKNGSRTTQLRIIPITEIIPHWWPALPSNCQQGIAYTLSCTC